MHAELPRTWRSVLTSADSNRARFGASGVLSEKVVGQPESSPIRTTARDTYCSDDNTHYTLGRRRCDCEARGSPSLPRVLPRLSVILVVMKFVFLNVWGEEMRDELVPYIENQAIDTDVFCFQEATDNMKLSCANALADYQEISGYKYISDVDRFPVSIFVKSGIEIITSGTLFADDMTVGIALYAELKDGDNHAFVCNVFGRSRPAEKLDNPDRLRFSQQLIEFFKDKGAPVIIGGDFNLGLPTESVGMFTKHNYRNLITEFNIETTRNHLVWDRYPDNKMLFSDYVFLNNQAQLDNFTVENNEVSDHLPMILQIKAK